MIPLDAVFVNTYKVCKTTGDTYDFSPEASAAYPFIYVGEAMDRDMSNSELMGDINQTVHLYGKRTDRLALSDMAVAIRSGLMAVKNDDNYYLTSKVTSIQRLPDNTDVTPLYHYIIEITTTYTRRN